MKKGKATKAQVKKERSPKKVEKVIKAKGHPSGKLPKGKEDRKSTRLNSSHTDIPRMPPSA